MSKHAPFFAIAVLVALLMWLCSCEDSNIERSPNGVYTRSEVETIMAAHLSGFMVSANYCDDKKELMCLYGADSLRIVKILWK